MAIARAFAPVDMLDDSVEFGDVTVSTPTEIVIAIPGTGRGYAYTGSFSSGFFGQVRGTLDRYARTLDGAAQVEATDIGASMSEVVRAVQIQQSSVRAAAVILGGDDAIFGSEGADVILGFDGDDVIRPGLGADLIAGGPGADVFAGSAAELDGDAIIDFSTGDVLRIEGAGLAPGSVSLAVDRFAAVASIAATASAPAATVTLRGDYRGADVSVAAVEGGVELRVAGAPATGWWLAERPVLAARPIGEPPRVLLFSVFRDDADEPAEVSLALEGLDGATTDGLQLSPGVLGFEFRQHVAQVAVIAEAGLGAGPERALALVLRDPEGAKLGEMRLRVGEDPPPDPFAGWTIAGEPGATGVLFTLTRPDAAAAQTVFLTVPPDGDAAAAGLVAPVAGQPVAFAAGQSVQRFSVVFAADRANAAPQEVGLVLRADATDPAAPSLAASLSVPAAPAPPPGPEPVAPGADFAVVAADDAGVWLSTASGALWRWNMATGAVERRADTGLALTDIAIDPDGRLFGITGSALHRLDPVTGASALVGPLAGQLFFGVNALGQANGFDISPAGVGRVSSRDNTVVATVDLATGAVSNDFGPLLQTRQGSAGDLWFTDDRAFSLSTTSSTIVNAVATQSGREVAGSSAFVANAGLDGLVGAPAGAAGVAAGTLIGFAGKTAHDLAAQGGGLRAFATLDVDAAITGAALRRGATLEPPPPPRPDEATLEFAARRVAYGDDLARLTQTDGYGQEGEFTALGGLFRAVALSRGPDDPQKILAIRGAVFDWLEDWAQNADPRGVGVTEFEAAWAQERTGAAHTLRSWLAENPGAHLVGHSQGGAQAQLLALAAQEAGLTLGPLRTYNAPSVTDPGAAALGAVAGLDVIHHVASGDVVSKAGETFLPGEVYFYAFESTARIGGGAAMLNFGLGYDQVARAHAGHWSQHDRYVKYPGVYDRAVNLRRVEPDMTAERLSAPDFSYIDDVGFFDRDYAAFKRFLRLPLPIVPVTFVEWGPQVIVPTTLLAGLLNTRAGVDGKRGEFFPLIQGLIAGRDIIAAFDPGPAVLDDPRFATAGSTPIAILSADPAAPETLRQPDPEQPAILFGLPGTTRIDSAAPGSLLAPAGPGVTMGLTGGGNAVALDPTTAPGARVEGFGPGDALRLSAPLPPAAVAVEKGSAVLRLDFDGDGAPDAAVTLEGDFDDARFAIAGRGGVTEIAIAGPDDVALPGGGARFITSAAAGVRVAGGQGADVIVGGPGDDVLAAGGGSNLLIGGPGADVLIAAGGGDNLRGGPGSDRFVFDGAAPAPGRLVVDFIADFTPGEDVLQIGGFAEIASFEDLNFRAAGPNLALELGPQRLVVLQGVADAAALGPGDVEIAAHADRLGFAGLASGVRLTEASDRLIYLGAEPVSVEAVAGDNVIVGGPGDDALRGGTGSDLLSGGEGDDRLTAGSGGGNLRGGPGADLFVFEAAAAPAGRVTVDLVEDFEVGVDRVALIGFGFSEPTGLALAASAAGVTLALAPGRFVVFRGLDGPDAFGDGDFLFG